MCSISTLLHIIWFAMCANEFNVCMCRRRRHRHHRCLRRCSSLIINNNYRYVFGSLKSDTTQVLSHILAPLFANPRTFNDHLIFIFLFTSQWFSAIFIYLLCNNIPSKKSSFFLLQISSLYFFLYHLGFGFSSVSRNLVNIFYVYNFS